MHIVVLEPNPSSQDGGQPLSTLEVSKGLAERGHQISLIYFKSGELVDQYRNFCSQIIPLRQDRVSKTQILHSLPKFIREIQRAIHALKHADRVNIIYLSNHRSILFGFALSLLKSAPVVLHIRTAITSKMVFHKQDRWPIQRVTQMIAVSENVKQAWVSSFSIDSGRIQVIHNGTNLNRFKPASSVQDARLSFPVSDEDRIISYVGRLSPDKGLDTLLHAFALLLKSSTVPTKLLISGKPSGFATLSEGESYERQLKALCQELQLTEFVQFLGHLSDPVSLYDASDLTVVPSVYPDPCPRAVLESLACGVPVIASKVGGIKEILVDEVSQFLCEPEDIECLESNLQKFLDWRVTTPNLGSICRQYAQRNLGAEMTINRVEAALLSLTH